MSSVLKLCPTCSSDTSFLYTAKAVVELGISTVKTLNPYSGELKSYRVDIEPFEPGYEDRGGLILTEISPSSNDLQRATEAKNALNDIHDFFNVDKVIPDRVVGSGHDIIGVSSNLNDVISHYNQSLTLGGRWSVYTGSLAGIAGKVVNVRITASIGFSDGMIGTIAISGINSKGEVEFVLIDMKDANGNDIPVNKKEAEDQKDNLMKFGSAYDVSVFLNTVSRFGVTYVRTMSRIPRGGRGSIIDIICHTDGKCVRVAN